MRGRKRINKNGSPKTAITQLEKNARVENISCLYGSRLNLEKLTLEAKGLIMYISSQPSHWTFTVEQACIDNGVGRKKLYRILRELIAKGLCKREVERGLNNTFASTNYSFRTNKRINTHETLS